MLKLGRITTVEREKLLFVSLLNMVCIDNQKKKYSIYINIKNGRNLDWNVIKEN